MVRCGLVRGQDVVHATRRHSHTVVVVVVVHLTGRQPRPLVVLTSVQNRLMTKVLLHLITILK